MDDETKAVLGFLARYTGHALENHESCLRKYKEWTLRMGIPTMLRAERWQLERYVKEMNDQGLAPATIAKRFSSVRLWFRFAHIDGLISKDPAAYVKTPNVDHTQQRRTWFDFAEMALVLRHATDPRDKAVLQTMFDLALRVGELCSLDVASMHRESTGVYLHFTGKGNKAARMAIPFVTLTTIDAYLAGRTEGPLFLNDWGNRITRWTVQRIITEVSTAAGISKRVTPHGIRRAHARTVVQLGGSYDDAAEDLRHVDSRITKIAYAVDTGIGDLGRQRVAASMANLIR